MARRRHIPKRPFQAVDLFPFLSIFLCIMGVLAFLQTLMATVSAHKIELKGSVGHNFKVAYQIFCTPDGVIVLPPLSQLKQLRASVPPESATRLDEIIEARTAQRKLLRGLGDGYMQAAKKYDIKSGQQLFDELIFINESAQKAGYLYEEFILFGLYPGSSRNFHPLREGMYEEKYKSINIGYEVLDNNWRFVFPKE